MTHNNDFRNTTRRSVLKGLALGAGTFSLMGTRSTRAALLPEGAASENADVVVIGTGIAGLAAALEAALAGASVVVLEKQPERESGGNTRLAGGLFSVPRDDTETARSEYVEDFDKKCLRRGNVTIFRQMAANGRAGIAWLAAQGVEFRPQADMPPYRVGTITAAPGIYMGMPKALATLTEKLKGAGGKVAYETKAKQLIMNNRGAAGGVRAIGTDGGVIDYRANAVVIAAGGYAGNQLILTDFVDPNAGNMKVRGVPWATGDGLMMAHEAGAGLRNMGGLASLHVAAVNPVETAAGNPWAGLPYGIAVNTRAERYVDESKGYVSNGKAALGQPGQTITLVMDSEIAKLPGPKSSLSTFRNLGIIVHEADTLAELAAQTGLPTQRLEETVTAFNGAVSDGKAEGATPPKAALAYPIANPPFLAFTPLVPGVTLTFGGITINERAEILETDGRVIPGLYAAGEGAGHAFFDDYIGGGSLTNCLVMGRIAGSEAARRAQ